MTLEDMFYLSQTVAGFALMGSMLFVALEVRGSNHVNRHRIIEEVLADYRDVREAIANNAEIARAWFYGLHDFEALDPLDKVRFTLVADLFFNTHQSIYLHFKGGRMSSALYEPQGLNMADFLRYPGLQKIWGLRRRYFEVSYQSHVDKAIERARSVTTEPHLYGEGTQT